MTTKTVTIIGAGLAGLSCALDLHQAGWQTTVLEARSRVGGRVYTLRHFANDQYAEAGGEFIDTAHLRMLKLVQAFHLDLETLPGMSDWSRRVALAGKNDRTDAVATWGADLAAELELVWQAFAGLGTAVPDPTQPHLTVNAHDLDQQSAADWLNTLPVHPHAKQIFAARVRSEYLLEPEQFSLLELARWAAFYYNTLEETPSYRIRGGNDQLVQAMARQLPDLRLEAVVTAVQQTPFGVTVTYQQDNTSQQISSDYVVVATPFGPARCIHFSPPLPTTHQTMLQGLYYGAVTKVLIQYQHRFWQAYKWNGSLFTDLPITCTWQPTGQQAGESGILTVYTGANAGAAFSALTDEERIKTAVSQLNTLFPGSADLVIHTQTMAWQNEPFTQGGYAAFRPGDVTTYWPTLRQPAGHIYFAGEHTAVHQGYMEGAVESGQRVASELRCKT